MVVLTSAVTANVCWTTNLPWSWVCFVWGGGVTAVWCEVRIGLQIWVVNVDVGVVRM
jgi:hypothetical protein